MESQESGALKVKINMLESKLNQKACKNGHWIMVEDKNITMGMRPIVTGCPNQRQDGSAHCLECSIKHNNK